MKHKARLLSFWLQGCAILYLFADSIRVALSRCLHIWDESIYALNSHEMAQTGNLLHYTTRFVADHHNSKPPLVIWLQAFFTAVLGPSELAVRLPSFLAMAGTVVLFYHYSRRITGSMRAGLIAAFALLTCSGLMRSHVFLSGDLDGMLCFFAFGVFGERLLQLHSGAIDAPGIRRMTLFLLLGYFTKSTAVFFLLPPLLMSFLLAGQLVTIMKSRTTWLMAGGLMFTIAAYYALREQLDRGYWRVVWYTEFVRATTNIQPWLNFPFRLYWDDLHLKFFRWQLRLLYVLLTLHCLLPRMQFRSLSFHAALMIAIFFLIVSIPDARIWWYAAPGYPWLCFLLGLALSQVLEFLTARFANAWVKESLILLLIAPLFLWWGWESRKSLEADMAHYEQPEYSTAFLKQLQHRHPEVNRFVILESAEIPRYIHLLDNILWYAEAAAISHSAPQVAHRQSLDSIASGDTLIIWQKPLLDSLRATYKLTELERWAVNGDTVRWTVLR